MNNYIFLHILINLYKNLEPENSNYILNSIEEYIEWLNISEKRFQFNYPKDEYDNSLISEKLKFFKEYQSLILLKDFNKAEEYLSKTISHYIYMITKEGSTSSFYR